MSVRFKQKEVSVKQRLNELDGLPAQVAQNTQALLPMGGYTGKNLLINGDFSVWQRGESFTAGREYTADRVFSINSANIVNRVKTVDPSNVSGSVDGISVVNAAQPNSGFSLSVELPATGNAGHFYKGRTFTVSCYAKSSAVKGTFGFSTSFETAIFPISTTSNQRNSTPEPLTTKFRRYTHTFTIQDTPATGDTIFRVQIRGFDTQGDTLMFASAQLELGSEATPFEITPPSLQLANCQRYYEELAFKNDGGNFDGGYSRINGSMQYASRKRTASPNIRFDSVKINLANSGTDDSANWNVGSAHSTINTFGYTCSKAGNTVNVRVIGTVKVDAEIY